MVITASLFFLAGQSLDYFVFKYRQNTIRKEIKTKIKNGVREKELFTFTITDICFGKALWVKPGKEFELNGTLYDVVRKEYKNGLTYYKCINDKQETKLFADLDRTIEKRMNEDSDDDYFKYLIKDFVKYIPEVVPLHFTASKKIDSSFSFHFFHPSYFFSFFSPPDNPI